MSNALQELRDNKAVLEKKIDEFRPKYLENPELLKSEWDGLVRKFEHCGDVLNDALKQKANNNNERPKCLNIARFQLFFFAGYITAVGFAFKYPESREAITAMTLMMDLLLLSLAHEFFIEYTSKIKIFPSIIMDYVSERMLQS